MVDNTLQTGASNIATDDIGGVHYQRVKVTFGADGTATDASSAAPFPAALIATSSRSSAFSAAVSSPLTTELNSLAAANYCAPSSAIDNSTVLDLYDDLELTVTFAVAPVVNTVVEVYLLPSLDGTNYADGASGTTTFPSPNLYVGGFPVRAVTTAQRLIFRGVPLPPGLFKYQIKNGTAQAFPASGSVMRRRPYNLQLG